MKKKYKKPSIKVEQYESDVCVAASYCNAATTITCLIGGQTENIFSQGQTGCDGYNLTKVYISGVSGITNGYYYIWYLNDVSNFDGTDNAYTTYLKNAGYESGYHIAYAVTEYSALTSG